MRSRLAALAASLASALAVLTFAQDAPPAATPVSPVSAAPAFVRMTTSKGDVVIELDRAKAPITTANFLAYVKKGQYDGTVFHRVIPTFMIQGGGFDQQHVEKQTGDPIVNEGANGLSNLRGTIAMARTNDPNSARAQFFINVVDNPRLDGTPGRAGYAVFGRVVRGMDVVDAIRDVPTGTKSGTMGAQTQPMKDWPLEEIVIVKAVEVPSPDAPSEPPAAAPGVTDPAVPATPTTPASPATPSGG